MFKLSASHMCHYISTPPGSVATMNYPDSSTPHFHPTSAAISLPPISTIDFRGHPAHHSPQDVIQPLPPPPPPPPPRQLPPLPYYLNGRSIPQQPEYVTQRALYPSMQVPSPYQLVSSRVPLPSTSDPNLMVAPARHKTKEVKRRTKTGCMTCRKRRIKCDEGRPECRNCMKSKRQCLGYDPVFQSQGPHSIHPAPSTQQNNTTDPPSSAGQNRRYTGTSDENTRTGIVNSLPVTSPATDFSFSKPPEVLPTLNQPYKMENLGQGMPSYTTPSRPPTARQSIEEICTIAGTRIPSIPAIPPDSVPNLDSIRKVYDIAFAPGLDKFLESSQHWYSREGFDLLADNRGLLGLVLAYLTLVSANHDGAVNENATLASQEARVTWGLLSLCIRPDQNEGDETTRLTRRFQILESLLTGEPLTSTATSISEFIHQEEPEVKPEPNPKEEEPKKQSAFEKQVARRSEEFWKTLESIAMAQGQGDEGRAEISGMLEQVKSLLDGRENRDIIYSILLLGWGRNGDPSSERELARRYLQTEAQGRATNQVCATLSGMALRAFDA